MNIRELSQKSLKKQNTYQFIMIFIVMGFICGIYISKWLNTNDIQSLTSFLMPSVIESANTQTFFITQLITNCLIALFIYFLGFSLIGIPFISFLLFTKGVQIGFSCSLFLYSFQIKGIVGIALIVLPQIIFDVSFMVLISYTALHLSYGLIKKILNVNQEVKLKSQLNQSLNYLILSLVIIVVSSYLKATVFLYFIKLFTVL